MTILCYLIYVKKYENTFYNIKYAKLKIYTTSHAQILPNVQITVHTLFFPDKDCNIDWKKPAMILVACSQSFSSVSYSQKSKLTYDDKSIIVVSLIININQVLLMSMLMMMMMMMMMQNIVLMTWKKLNMRRPNKISIIVICEEE